jgi:xylulokinase
VRAAARQVAEAAHAAGHVVAALNVAAMVPSLCPVDADGVPIGPGLLYGDERAKGGGRGLDPSQDGELVRMLTWLAAAHPEAAGYWPAQAVGNAALCGEGVIDSVTAMTTLPLFDFTGWDPAECAGAGVRSDQLPAIRSGSDPAGRCRDDLGPALEGAVVGGGTIDAFGEQLVAGADEVGDVLLIMGATLIVWACVAEWVEAPGLWTVPHTAPGKVLIGGPSNAGGILRDWAASVLVAPVPPAPGEVPAAVDPDDVPVVLPYVRGERTPLHDRDRRGSFHGLSVAHGPDAMWRAVHEASGHSVRHHLELAGVLGPQPVARRIVATGGGVRAAGWVQVVADVTGLPVDVVSVPEGGALGSAYLARVAAGLEPDASGASRWARTSHRVVPDPAWVGPCTERHERFVDLTGPVFDPGAAP